MYFLALSHAPPLLFRKVARTIPPIVPTISRPASACGPRMVPTAMGVSTATTPSSTITFCQCLRGVTHTVKRVGNVTYSFGLPAHLGDTTCIVGDGTEGVHGKNVGGAHQHTHGGNGGTKDTTDVDYTGVVDKRNGDLAAKEERKA